jgi:hypothetical protein
MKTLAMATTYELSRKISEHFYYIISRKVQRTAEHNMKSWKKLLYS